jgi:hypothetical protein
MPALIGWLIEAAGTLVGQVLLALGISFLSYKGLDSMIGAAKSQFFTSVAGLSPTTVAMLGAMKVDVAVNMLCSALVGRLTVAGMTSGVLKKLVFK